jgi:hypothetical protein
MDSTSIKPVVEQIKATNNKTIVAQGFPQEVEVSVRIKVLVSSEGTKIYLTGTSFIADLFDVFEGTLIDDILTINDKTPQEIQKLLQEEVGL